MNLLIRALLALMMMLLKTIWLVVGSIVFILQLLKLPDGTVKVLVEGEYRKIDIYKIVFYFPVWTQLDNSLTSEIDSHEFTLF